MAQQSFTKTVTVTLYDGTRKRIKKRGHTQAEVDEKIQKALWEYERGLLVISTQSTVEAWAKEWMEVYAKPNQTEPAFAMTEVILRRHVIPALGNMRLSDLRSSQLQRFANSLSGLSASYTNKIKAVIRGIVTSAQANQLITVDPLLNVRFPKNSNKERRALTAEERVLFEAALEKSPHALLFGAMYYMGLRPSEARALMFSDFRDGMLYVSRAVKADGKIGKPKTESGIRVIPVQPWYQERLNKAPRIDLFINTGTNGLMTHQEAQTGWKSLKNDMYDLAGVRRHGTGYSKADAERLGLFEITPYYLRHTYATILAENNVDIKTAQRLLGHSDIGMTADIYTHVTKLINMRDYDKVYNIDFSGSLKNVPHLSREKAREIAK